MEADELSLVCMQGRAFNTTGATAGRMRGVRVWGSSSRQDDREGGR